MLSSQLLELFIQIVALDKGGTMKLLIFLIALTFLFLFSETIFGGVFNKNDPTVVNCIKHRTGIAVVISMKDKTIKYYEFTKLYKTYTIEEETEAYIKGLNDLKTRYVFISRQEYEGKIRLVNGIVNEGKLSEIETYSCRIGIKKF